MRIGLIDVDGHNYPNLPLMKISAWHKKQGDTVEWYDALLHSMEEPFDRVYMAKVFSFSKDYPYHVNAREVIKGGTGYCISLIDGKEVFDKSKNIDLPYEIEHIYPDYSIYHIKDTAYGFLTRGCPRGCDFCHIEAKEGRRTYKVADLSEFWNGQKNIVLMDANITACREWKELFQQLIDSKATIDINQGMDIRLMTDEKAEMIKQMDIKNVHFAWDDYKDKDWVIRKLKRFKEITDIGFRKLTVYMLTNFDTTHNQDLERVYTIRDLGYTPYVMIYNKDDFVMCDKNGKPIKRKPDAELLKKYTAEQIKHFDLCWSLQRWVNNKIIFRSCNKFEDYKKG